MEYRKYCVEPVTLQFLETLTFFKEGVTYLYYINMLLGVV